MAYSFCLKQPAANKYLKTKGHFMDTSRNEINYLTMHFGTLQVLPKQMANLNRRLATHFENDVDESGSALGYQVLLTG